MGVPTLLGPDRHAEACGDRASAVDDAFRLWTTCSRGLRPHSVRVVPAPSMEQRAGRPGPRQVVLAPHAWGLLADAAAGVPLPAPFVGQPVPGPVAAERAERAEQALRSSGAVPGASGDLLADLRASLLVQLAPEAVVDTVVGHAGRLVVARHALSGPLASGLSRQVVSAEQGDGTAELVPVIVRL